MGGDRTDNSEEIEKTRSYRRTTKAYDSADFRRKLRRRGIKSTIPTFERRKRKRPQRGCPLRVGAGYRQRWKVER